MQNRTSEKITLDTLIPFTTDDYYYLNHGATDRITGDVYAYQSISFSEWGHVWAYLAISKKALDALLDKGLPAIPDFPSLMHNREPRDAFRLEAWNCVKIGISFEAIELSVSNSESLPLSNTVTSGKTTLEQMEAFLDTGVLV